MDTNFELMSYDDVMTSMKKLEEEAEAKRRFIASSRFQPPEDDFTQLRNLESAIFRHIDELDKRRQRIYETQTH